MNILTYLFSFRHISRIDDVSSMRSTGRDSYRYYEGDHSMEIYAELSAGQPEREIAFGSIKCWEPPFENETISEGKKKDILSKVCKYFQNNRITYTIR